MRKLFKTRWIFLLSLLVYLTNDIKAQTNFVWGKQFGTDKNEFDGTMPVVDKSLQGYVLIIKEIYTIPEIQAEIFSIQTRENMMLLLLNRPWNKSQTGNGSRSK
jgi:hypothetical protein